MCMWVKSNYGLCCSWAFSRGTEDGTEKEQEISGIQGVCLSSRDDPEGDEIVNESRGKPEVPCMSRLSLLASLDRFKVSLFITVCLFENLFFCQNPHRVFARILYSSCLLWNLSLMKCNFECEGVFHPRKTILLDFLMNHFVIKIITSRSLENNDIPSCERKHY